MENASGKPPYSGVEVYMGGKVWVIPGLSVKQFRLYKGTLAELGEIGDRLGATETFDKVIPIVTAALQRNYPDVTDEQVEEMLDMNTFKVVMGAVATGSGLRQLNPGESQPDPPK
jgi:hypothetical protein